KHKWFEESLCELASLFVLRQSAETWKTKAPYPNWKGYSAALKKYADERAAKSQLPAGTTLAQWHRDNAAALMKDSCDRPRNNVVAVQLLPLFEKAPEHWAALGALNAENLDASCTFQQYLEAWHRNCPAEHRGFVREIASKFEVEIKPAGTTDERR
ncbi:MAG: hypothetical protein NTW87_17390, partial [Planctomycetota bacterium]|nr:hypothetical protein [Planctomycetota bacterium]